MRRLSLLRLVSMALGGTILAAMVPSCVLAIEEGSAVELLVSAPPPAGSDSVQIHDGWLAVHDAWLVRCEEAQILEPSPVERLAAIGRSLLAPSVARAHHPEDASHLDGSVLVSLVTDGERVGMLRPEVARYCGLAVLVAPSPALDDRVLELRGESSEGDFTARGFAMGVWTLPFETPLIIDASHPRATVELSLDVIGAVRAVSLDGSPEEVGLDLWLALRERAVARPR